MAAPSFYNQADQDIYNLGYSFIPQEMYRGGAFNLPTTNLSTAIKNNPSGISTLPTTFNMNRSSLFNESGPSMNQIRTDYSPYAYRQAMASSGVGIPSGILSDSKFLYAPESKIEGLLNFIPGIGTLKRGAEFLSGILPINQRSILENELRGSGVLTDNIGRIVSQRGQYNTPEGIMAGYNAAMMNEGTFDKRTDRISKTLGSKYGLTKDQISGIIDGTIDEEDLGLTTNLISNLRNIELAKKNFINQKKKSAEIVEFQKAKKSAAAAKQLESQRKGRRPGTGGGGEGKQDSRGPTGGYSYDSGGRQGFGYGLKNGGLVSLL